MTENPIAVFWFRRDLRLQDNRGLFQALNSSYPVLPIFIFDRNILEPLSDKKDKRVNFIYDIVKKINDDLKTFHASLFIMHDEPLKAFEKLCSRFYVREVYANHDYEPYAIKRDKEIAEYLQSKEIAFQTFKDQVIFEKAEIVKNDGTPYTVFTPYSNRWKEEYKAQKPVFYPSEKTGANFLKSQPFHFPSLKSIGFEKNDPRIAPLEIDRQIISSYDKNRNIPALDGTTKLSVHLRFGTVSVRELATLANELNDHWLNELIWREFFMMILFHFPRLVTESFKMAYDHIPWRNDEKEFNAWCKGETGYPIVDAGMRELNETGFMHNRVRMIVASFLAKHLLIDWRWGEAYFAEKLLDYELSSNNGNWQWAAGCGCDAAPYFRVFNPTEQTKKFDPGLIYIKKWIRDFDSYQIHPIVEHEFARKRALAVYQKALAEAKNEKSPG